MTRQVPHAEDIATGVATAGLVPVSTGPGLPPAWGAASGALANVGGWRDQYNQAGTPANSGAAGDTANYKAFRDANTVALKYVPLVVLHTVKNAGVIYEGPDWTRAGRTVTLVAALGSGDKLSVAYLYDPTQPVPIVPTDLISYVPTGGDRRPLGYALSVLTSGDCQKCLGASSAPAGWETVGFDDSSWIAPVGADTGTVGALWFPAWHSGDNLDGLGTFFRHTWSGKSPASSVTIQAGFGVSTPATAVREVYLNGVSIYTGSGNPDWAHTPQTITIPGTIDQSGTNVLAIHAVPTGWVHSSIGYILNNVNNPWPTNWNDPLLDDSGWAPVVQGKDAGGANGTALAGTTAVTANQGNVGYNYQWLIRHHMTLPAGAISSALLTIYTKAFVLDLLIDGVSIGHWNLADGATANLNQHTFDVTSRLQTLLGSAGGDFVLAAYLRSPDNAGGRTNTYTYTSYKLSVL